MRARTSLRKFGAAIAAICTAISISLVDVLLADHIIREGFEALSDVHDQDGDGYCANELECNSSSILPGDCLDNNSDVNPGHSTFETVAYWTGTEFSYDYNCDGSLTEQLTGSYGYCFEATPLNCVPVGVGWDGSAPDCGELGNYVNACYWDFGCYPVILNYTQGCY